jgi:hypothetical protein
MDLASLMHRARLLTASIAFASVLNASVTAAEPPQTPHPNVVVIVVDDLGWAGVGFHASEMPTPRLNELASQSEELQRFYVYPVCSPTRVALLTGRMPRRYNVMSALNGNDPGMPSGVPTIAAAFKQAGYQTSLIGKWHVGKATTPLQNGFDHFYGFLGPAVDYYTHNGNNGRLDWQRNGTAVREEGYSTDLLAAEAVSRIKSRDAQHPFYLQVTFNAPHDPLSAPPELIEKHKAKGQKLGLYAAVVEALDTGIGRILDAIDEEHLRDQTLVVFFSDNGAAGREGGSNLPLKSGKGTVKEGGIRTPALARWPGKIAPGVKLTQPISVQDLFPTLAAAAGIKVPDEAHPDGVDQWPAMQRGVRVDREPFLVASFDTAIIDGDWKLIAGEDGAKSLYNLKDDPSEKTNLASKEPEIVSRLAAKLEATTKDLPEITAKRQGPLQQRSDRSGPGKGPGNGGGRPNPPRDRQR